MHYLHTFDQRAFEGPNLDTYKQEKKKNKQLCCF